jgi:hypothetical protein
MSAVAPSNSTANQQLTTVGTRWPNSNSGHREERLDLAQVTVSAARVETPLHAAIGGRSLNDALGLFSPPAPLFGKKGKAGDDRRRTKGEGDVGDVNRRPQFPQRGQGALPPGPPKPPPPTDSRSQPGDDDDSEANEGVSGTKRGSSAGDEHFDSARHKTVEISELLPHGIDTREYPHYVVVYRERPFFLRFLGKEYGVMGISHPYQATRRITGWDGQVAGMHDDPNVASEQAMRSWAMHSHPLLVAVVGLFKREVIRYRSESAKEWGVSFWDK